MPRDGAIVMENKCVHHEVIDSVTMIGICIKCGQRKQYSDSIEVAPVLLGPEGSDVKRDSTEIKGKRGSLTDGERSELVRIGPQEFAEKYGYDTRGRGGLARAYKYALRNGVVQTPKAPDATGVVDVDETSATSVLPPAMALELPECLKIVLELLPLIPMPLTEVRRDGIKMLFGLVIDEVYR